MDIPNIAGSIKTAKLTQDRKTADDKGFANVLDKTIGSTNSGASAVQTAPPVGGMVPITCGDGLSGDELLARRASNILILLEKYGYALQDPKRTLKSIEPLVQEIHTEIDSIKAEVRHQDGGLSKIANDIAVTATVEALKYERGDYVG